MCCVTPMPSLKYSYFHPVMEKFEDYGVANKNIININDIESLSPKIRLELLII